MKYRKNGTDAVCGQCDLCGGELRRGERYYRISGENVCRGCLAYDGRKDIRAWLFTIGRNTFYSHCRKRGRAVSWEELREKYEAGGYTYMQLAKEYGVSVQSVGRHARKENWVSGCRNERRRRAESRACLLEMTRALMRGAKRAAEEAEKGEACTKELKELAGILQTLAGLEKELGGGTAVQTVQVLMGEGVRELSE